MSEGLRWAGVDTSTRTYSVCIVDAGGGVVSQADLPADTEAAHAFLNSHTPTLVEVALETGTTSVHLARTLAELGYAVSIYDALKVRRFLQLKLNKTDTNDAHGLAEVARIGGAHLRKTYLKPLSLSVLRSKLVIRERMIKMRKLNEAAMMSLLHAYGVRADVRPSSQPSLRRIVMKMIRDVERNYEVPIRDLIIPLIKLSATLRKEELRLEKELKDYAFHSDICCRLMEIPGVGVITAVSFVTAIGDPHRFHQSCDVGAYLGLTPRVWRTGIYTKRRGISKIGNRLTRKHLHIAARGVLDSRIESSLQTWAKGLADRTNRRKAVVALARKLAVVMLTIWKTGSRFELVRPLATAPEL